MNQYNGANRSSGTKKYSSSRKALNKFYVSSVTSPSIIQLIALGVMWAVGMMLIFEYTDVFRTAISASNILFYLLIIGSTTVLFSVILAFFRRR